MKPRLGEAAGRILVALALAFLVGFGTLAAQQTTGKIEGTVTDQAGVPIANGQVVIIGTSFGALTNERGYYFINNVPVGAYTLRAQFIGYAPTELRGVRVTGGQTATADLKLQPTAVVVGGITVEAAANPIVPRDQVSTKSIISGDQVDRLPIDDVRGVLALQPGVVESGDGAGLSLRGGRPGEANVYIDGAPVRSAQSGSQGIGIGTNAIEEASVTTGALGVEFSDAQSGVLSFVTRAGGERVTGNLTYETDEPFGNGVSVGFNRFEGSLGGPVPMISGLRFHLSGVTSGRQSSFQGRGAELEPTYVMGGRDTTVRLTAADGSITNVDVPRFVQYSGQCAGGSSSNPVRQAILDNYGFECQGRRLPFNWNTDIRLTGKLQYTYGSGSFVSLTTSAQGNQGRNFPGSNFLNPSVYGGFHNWNRLAVLNVDHTVFRTSERSLALKLNLSWANENTISGALTAESDIDSRDPAMGITFKTLNFEGFGAFGSPMTEDIIRNIRTNTGLRVPLLDRNDLRFSQPYRINPYGLSSGFVSTGFDVGGTRGHEKRYGGRLQADWQANRFHRFQFGGEYYKHNLAFFSSGFLRQSFMDAYILDPVKARLFASDRLDLGDVVLELGVRWDYYNANTLFPRTPFRIFTHPRYNQLYTQAPTNDAVYAAFLADTNIWVHSVAHRALSPVLRVAFPVTEKTNFRLSYAHQVQTPPFSLLAGINNDLSFTNTNDIVGRDLRFAKSIQFEFGVRHAFSSDMVLDISAYNKDKVADFAGRIRAYDDPANPGDTLNANIFTNADFGNTRGVDVKLDRRVGNYLNASISYTFQVAKNTGSDPLSYINGVSRQISQVTGERVHPAEAALITNDDRTHNLVGAISLTLPSDWRRGTTLGSALRDVSVFATFSVVSGLPYTRQENQGAGTLAPRQAFGLIGTASEPVNSSRMPWIKNVDLRLTKGVSLGRTDWTLFVDARNVFNFRNITRLFVETGDVVNAVHREGTLQPVFIELRNEANNAGALVGQDIRLTSCGGWANPVNCVALRRTEARFGNGDLTYTADEQTRALNAYYDDYVRSPSGLLGAPRHVRVGFEVNF